MGSPSEYLAKKDITKEQMGWARAATRACVDAYALREARSEGGTTQAQLAYAMGVFQTTASPEDRRI